MSQAIPHVSVVIIIGTQRERSARALASILSQQNLEKAEVLLFDTALDRFPPLAGSDHPAVTVYPEVGLTPFSVLRAKGVKIAHGGIIAFLEDHAMVVPGWLDALIKDFEAGHGGVGGEPEIINPGVGISDAITVMNYAFFRPVPVPRTYYMLPGHNSAYRRDLLLSFGDELADLLSSEVLLNQKITKMGFTLLLDRGAKFQHLNEESLRMISRGYYYWNLSFGRNRAKTFHWSWPRRILQALSIPLIPFVRYVKYMYYFLRHDRKSMLILFRYTAVFLYAQGAAALGLAIGCTFGAGDAEMKFREYELNSSRKLEST